MATLTSARRQQIDRWLADDAQRVASVAMVPNDDLVGSWQVASLDAEGELIRLYAAAVTFETASEIAGAIQTAHRLS